jgi:hypothetical protein
MIAIFPALAKLFLYTRRSKLQEATSNGLVEVIVEVDRLQSTKRR